MRFWRELFVADNEETVLLSVSIVLIKTSFSVIVRVVFSIHKDTKKLQYVQVKHAIYSIFQTYIPSSNVILCIHSAGL